MTQTQLADLLHVSANAVSKWELGKNSFDLQNLNTLANVLDIPLDQLSCRRPEKAAQAVPLPEPAPAIKAEKKRKKENFPPVGNRSRFAFVRGRPVVRMA